ncbi:MAG: hypothetical protein WC554_19775 [Clostridia bacterium]
MDENKLKLLKEVDYKVVECCGICIYSKFEAERDFGVCLKHSYLHKKHTEQIRNLSIYRYGKCNHFPHINLGYEAEKFFDYLE